MNSLCVRWPFQWLLELYHSKAWYGFIYSGVYDTVDPLPLHNTLLVHTVVYDTVDPLP